MTTETTAETAVFSAIAMLTAQAILLDKLFTRTANTSLACTDEQEAQMHAAAAIKIQHYCRQTILTIEKLQTLPPLHAGRKLDPVTVECVQNLVNEALARSAAAIEEMYKPVFAYKAESLREDA